METNDYLERTILSICNWNFRKNVLRRSMCRAPVRSICSNFKCTGNYAPLFQKLLSQMKHHQISGKHNHSDIKMFR